MIIARSKPRIHLWSIIVKDKYATNQSELKAEYSTGAKRGKTYNLHLARENVQSAPSAGKYVTSGKGGKYVTGGKGGKYVTGTWRGKISNQWEGREYVHKPKYD